MTETTMPSFSLGLVYAPWVSARVKSFHRLTETLRVTQDEGGDYVCNEAGSVRVFCDRAHYSQWSADLWAWGAKQETSHFLTLQDDAIVDPDFWLRVTAMVEANPGAIICLEAAHKGAYALAVEGHNWFTTTDGMIGVGYILPTSELREFMTWRATLPPSTLLNLTEDTLLAVWCAGTSRKIHHPIPTIIDHDITIASTNVGNDNHPNRRPTMPWHKYDSKWRKGPNVLESEISWNVGAVPHLGRFYEATPRLLEEFFPGATADLVENVGADNGIKEMRRLAYFMRSRPSTQEPRKILLCTPTRGGVHPQYAASVWTLLKDETLDCTAGWEITDVQLWHEDVVRVRNRFVHFFLNRTDCDYLLFIDSDISFHPAAVRGLLAANKGFVAIPYPRRDSIDFESIRKTAGTELPPEAAGYRYPVQLMNGEETLSVENASGCAQIQGIGLGLALLSRPFLEKMTKAYGASGYRDALPGGDICYPANLFEQIRTKDARFLSEDYSFCHRTYLVGEKVWMYLGEGSPASHWGDWGYKGVIESFGIKSRDRR